MRLSILVVVTNPDERQDKWREALANYCNLADEVVVVNGGHPIEYHDQKVKIVDMVWPENWDWEELPKHLNYAKQFCTGDWILKMDIDQLVDTEHKATLYRRMENAAPGTEALTLSKVSFVANMRYFMKSKQPILFRNYPYIGFGYNRDFPQGDLGMPMRMNEADILKVEQRPENCAVPHGSNLAIEHTHIPYWNFSFTFKTQEIARPHLWRSARAYNKFRGFGPEENSWGRNEEEAFKFFLDMLDSHIELAKNEVKLGELPREIQEAVRDLKPEQLGYDAWGRIKR